MEAKTMRAELAEKILLEMNSKAKIGDLETKFGEDVKKVFDLLSTLGLVELRGDLVVVTEKGRKFRELPSP